MIVNHPVVLKILRVVKKNAALVKADFFFAGAHPIGNKIEQKNSNTKVASG